MNVRCLSLILSPTPMYTLTFLQCTPPTTTQHMSSYVFPTTVYLRLHCFLPPRRPMTRAEGVGPLEEPS